MGNIVGLISVHVNGSYCVLAKKTRMAATSTLLLKGIKMPRLSYEELTKIINEIDEKYDSQIEADSQFDNGEFCISSISEDKERELALIFEQHGWTPDEYWDRLMEECELEIERSDKSNNPKLKCYGIPGTGETHTMGISREDWKTQ